MRHDNVKELMIGLIEKFVSPDLVILDDLLTNILLLSLPSSFDGFVMNFNMNKMEEILEELVNGLDMKSQSIKKKMFS